MQGMKNLDCEHFLLCSQLMNVNVFQFPVMPTKEASQRFTSMKPLYYVYIVTNPERTVLYTGVTKDLVQRLIEHYVNRGNHRTFAGRYYCYNLIFYEDFLYINDAIAREKEIKGWRRKKKLSLIKTVNKNWTFLNAQLCEGWPPKEITTRN